MAASFKVVGFDPSLRNWGIACGEYSLVTGEILITALSVTQPVLTTNKQVRANSKDLEATQQLATAAIAAARGANAVFVEIPHGSQSAAAMRGYGICIGILGTLREGGIPFFELTPTEVKLASVGNKNATKEQMIDWGMRTFPQAPWPMKTTKGVTSVISGTAEHMADACAAIVAGIQSQPFRQIQQMRVTHKR